MTSIEVRTFATTEWELLRDLRLEALRDAPEAFSSTVAYEVGFEPDRWQARTTTSAVAFRGGEPVGLVGWHQPVPAVPRLELVSMWVRADARGSDIASGLVDHVVAIAGADLELVLRVMPDNGRARAFYARAGFVTSIDPITEVNAQCLIHMTYQPSDRLRR